MFIRNGRPFPVFLTEGEDEPASGGGSNATEVTTIKVGDKEISQTELSNLITGDAAGNVKVDLGEGKTATLKELREAHRRQPDVQRLLADERKVLEDEYAVKKQELETERTRLTEGVSEAGKDQATRIAEAIRDALGDKRGKDPFVSKESAIAYITEKLRDDWTGGISDLVGQIFDGRATSAAEVKKAVDDAKKEMLAELRESQKSEQAQAFMRDEVRALQEKYPSYNPKGRDEFSALVNVLMRNEEPDPILDGKVGIDTPAVEVARMVDIHLTKQARARVKTEDDAQKRRDDESALHVRQSGKLELTDELQKEMDAAGTDSDKVNAVLAKYAKLRH